jgi:hypothetical protein
MRIRISVSPRRLLTAIALAVLLPGSALAVPSLTVDAAAPAMPPVIEGATGACTIETGPIGNVSSAWQGPDFLTAIATPIQPTQCSACPSPQILTLNSVSFRLRWLTACSATAEVSIVGATGSPGCLAPDPSQVLCGPLSYTVSGPGSVGIVHTLPLPSGCCVSQPAFVLVRFTGFESCSGGSAPGITNNTLACSPCQSWWSTVLSYPSLSDRCLEGTGAGLSQTWLSVDADCCAPTPALPKSWGDVKTFYR